MCPIRGVGIYDQQRRPLARCTHGCFGLLIAVACSSDSPETQPTAGVIEGKFDIGGHKLYLSCVGTGTPTIVYLHGSIVESSVDPHANGTDIQRRLRDDYRVCVYDRRNLAHSDTVDAPQSPNDAVNDLHDLLATAQVKPPYVLLGASFGGLLSYLYANLHSDEVVGMVLLDSPFPDELTLEHLFQPKDRYEAFDEEDGARPRERTVGHAATTRLANKVARFMAAVVSARGGTSECGGGAR